MMTGPADPWVSVRAFEERDIDFALSQTSREGWDTTREAFEIHLAHDPEGCFVGDVDGQPAGMITTTRYRLSGWVGELIVSPDYRRRGIGTALMRHAIRYLQASGMSTLRLEGDPPGIPIYEKLGFVHEFVSPRFRLEKCPRVVADRVARLDSAHWADVAAFDEPHFGDDRGRLLREVFSRARAVYRSPGEGPLAGYLTVQSSAAGARIGPWVASNTQVARELLDAALSELEGETVIVALPGVNPAGQELLKNCGFVETPASFRMVRGPSVARGRPENVYALASGAFG